MLTVVKPVYYCEHCKRHRMTKAAILKHEPRCIYNPLRDKCGWHNDMKPIAPADLVAVFIDNPDLDWLHDQVDGCPACMLAVVCQSRRAGLDPEETQNFNYADVIAKYRESERYEDAVSW